MEIKKDQYYIVRTDRAGVFFGKIKEKTHETVTMTDVRKLWYWDGAAAVEELALKGTNKPEDCKFTVTISEMEVESPIQVIPCTDKAVKSVQAVREWKA